jgi:hypothetical protein
LCWALEFLFNLLIPLSQQVYLFPLPCKQGSLSFVHTREDIGKFVTATREILSTECNLAVRQLSA